MVFANVQHNYELLKGRIEKACQKSSRKPEDIRIVAITKTHPAETVQALIDLGIRDIGENRVQEIEQKAPFLKGEFSMHMVGHLQTNKVSKVLPLVAWIQSIDSLKLVDKINSLGEKAGIKIKVLVEVNTSGESAKTGCRPQDCRALCEYVSASKVMELSGLMTVGPLTGGEPETRKSFGLLTKLAEQCRHVPVSKKMVISMGMSADFEWAIEEGSTMIRVGSLLLGNRLPGTIN
jgi:pyridoxal phosphate enzyme (YggS family)